MRAFRWVSYRRGQVMHRTAHPYHNPGFGTTRIYIVHVSSSREGHAIQHRISSTVRDTGTVCVLLSVFPFAFMMHPVQEAHICWAGWLSVRVEHCWKHWWCVRRQACCLGIELPFNRGRSIPQRFAGISSSKTKEIGRASCRERV